MADNKRSSTQETLRRMLRLARLIPAGRKTSVSEIKSLLEQEGDIKVPSERTLQRDLKMLAEELKLEVTLSGRTLNYSYPKDQKYQWHQSDLGEKESLLLMMAQSHLGNLLPANLQQVLDKQFHRADQILNFEKQDSLQGQWRNKIRVVQGLQPLLPPSLKQGIFEAVSKALYSNLWLTLTYTNSSGELKENKRVQPLGLVQQEQRLYLVCIFESHKNLRYLPLSRMHKAQCGTMTFQPPKDFCLATLEEQGFFGVSQGEKVRLRFNITRAAGQHLLESKLSHDQSHAVTNDGYQITATVPDTLFLERWINSFGKDISNVEKLPLEASAA